MIAALCINVDLTAVQTAQTVLASLRPGLHTEVALHGTVNDDDDEDEGWEVMLAIPWASLEVLADGRPAPPVEGMSGASSSPASTGWRQLGDWASSRP